MEKKHLVKDYFDENESIKAFFTIAQREKNMHSHTFWELVYIYEGCGINYTNDGEKNVKDGVFLFMKPGVRHSLVSPTKGEGAPLRVCNCIFTQEYLNTMINEYAHIEGIKNYALFKHITNDASFSIQLNDDNARNINHLMWLIAHEYNHFTIGSEEIIRQSFLSLLICITRLYEYQTNRAIPTVSKNSDIDKLMKYIRSNFASKLTLDLLAAHIHLSREYLCRYFKKYTGKTISDFLLEVRIAQAKQMLRTTSHSVTDIGAYCGYPSVSNFQRSFKRVVGMSPNEFRIAEGAKTL